MTVDEKMAALGVASLFRDFTDKGKRIFAEVARERTLAAGSPLFAADAPGDAMFVVVSGTVRLTQKGADGSEREVAQLGSGEQLGELALLAPGLRLLSASATTDALLLEIAHDDFLELAPQRPQACLKLASAIAAHLARRIGDSRDLLRDALARAAAT